MLEIVKLRCLHTKNPMGVDVKPYFSWQLKSDLSDVVQKSYHIMLKDEARNMVWDSGKIISEQSTYIEYMGENLASCTLYFWNVSVTDNNGQTASGTGTFETAFLEQEKWTAKWIKSPYPVCERQAHLGEQPPAVLFRQKIFLHKPTKKARLYATCHGVYQLKINGVRPDDREFAPECTVYREYLCYQTYDVTNLLLIGENVIGMHVGDGWYHGFMTKALDDDYDPALAVLFQLEVLYTDGTSEIFGSDESMSVAESPVLCSDLFAGERYDANRSHYGWDMPECSDNEGWKIGLLADFGYQNLRAQYEAPVRPVKILPVSGISISPKGERIIDFGQVIAGRVRIHMTSEKGNIVTIIHTESLDKDGNFFDNNPTADQKIEFISDGKEITYEPHFTFQGFRYVMVDGIEDLKKEDICAVVLSSEKENAGTFSCSDDRVTKLYRNTRWSQCANMISIPTDCPQREKAGWTGDIQVYAKTALLNEDVSSFLTRWLKNLAIEQKNNGSVPFVIPLAGAYIGMYQMYEEQYHTPEGVAPAGWGDAAVMVPYDMYCITGNRLILKQQYRSMKKWCDFVLRTAREQRPADSLLPDEIEQYLWNTGHHYGEHLIPSFANEGYGAKTFEAISLSTRYVAPVYAYLSVSKFAEIAEVLGETEDADYYGMMAGKIKEAIGSGVIDEQGNMPADLMGAYAMPLYYDLVPEHLREHFKEKLVRKLKDNEMCLDTGFLGTPVLQDTLCKIGRPDLAYDLLFQTKAPSWLYEVEHGATTIWESWFALAEDGTPYCSEVHGFTFTMSLNHYAFGCVDDWIFRNVNGIQAVKPGYKQIRIQPLLDDRLDWAKRTFESEYGTIVSDWKKRDNVFELDVEIPCNTTADIILPDGRHEPVGSGRFHFSCNL